MFLLFSFRNEQSANNISEKRRVVSLKGLLPMSHRVSWIIREYFFLE